MEMLKMNFFIADSFKAADSSANKLQFTSTVESSEESAAEAHIQRRKRPRVLFSPPISPKTTKKKSQAVDAQKAIITPPVTPAPLKPIHQSKIFIQIQNVLEVQKDAKMKFGF